MRQFIGISGGSVVTATYLTTTEVAEYLGVSRSTVHRARTAAGHIMGVPFVKINRRWMISRPALDAIATKTSKAS